MGKSAVESVPTASCRLDWLSLSFYAASETLQKKQLGWWLDAFGRFVPEPTFKDGAGRKFFEYSVFHDAGIGLRWTPPDGARNAGFLNVDLKGEFFKLTNPAQRAAIYLDASELEGFKHCTRLDAQRTLLDPHADAEEVHRMVREREVWVARYKGFRQLGETDSKGDAVKGASVVWGGPESAARGMTYNKAAEDGWDGLRAVRHEVLLRRQPARDCFQTLRQMLLQEEGPGCRYLAEVRFVQSVLAKQMTYLDTSRLAAVTDKAQWPENWAADSQPAEFWREVVDGNPVELTTTWRQEKSLEDSVAAMNNQYGRKAYNFVMWRMYGCGQSREEALDELFDCWAARAKEEDLPELVKLAKPGERKALAREFHRWRQAAAHNLEGFARRDPLGAKTDTAL